MDNGFFEALAALGSENGVDTTVLVEKVVGQHGFSFCNPYTRP